MLTSVHTIGVVGAGTMGSGVAQVFAHAGFIVRLADTSRPALDRARAAIDASLAKLVDKGKTTIEDRRAALERISMVTSLDSLAGADYVVEAIVEDASAKRALFTTLDALVRPAVILASNTSSIPITSLAAATRRPDKVLGMHFMNPVPLMGLVELVRGRETSDDSMELATDLCRAIGKTGVESADRPGFIASRILMPMLNEAFYAVMEGVGTPDAIDAVAKGGLNHPMGPLALADQIGLDVCLAVLQVLHEGLGDRKHLPCPLLIDMVKAGRLGRKSGRGFYVYA